MSGHFVKPLIKEQQLLKIYNSLYDVVAAIDAEGYFVYLNNAVNAAWGYTPQEITGTSCFSIMVEEDREPAVQAIALAVTGVEIGDFENRYYSKEGLIITMIWKAVWDAEEGLLYCTSRDATEEKRLQQEKEAYQKEIKNNAKEIANILHRIDEGFVALDAEWHIKFCSKKAQRVFNKTEADLGKNIWSVFPELVGNLFYQKCHLSMALQKFIRFESFHPILKIWFDISIYPSADGLSIFFTDITERKTLHTRHVEFELKMKEQNETMVEVLERMEDGFITLNNEGRVLYWNRAAETITQISRDAILEKNIWELMENPQQSAYYSIYQQLLATSEPIHREVRTLLTHKWIELHVYPTKQGISVFFRDIDQRKKTEEELRRFSLIAKETVNQVVITNADREVIWVNNAFTMLTGYTLEESVGKLSGDIFDGPETDPKTLDYVVEKFARLEPFHIEALNYKKDGTTYWSDISCQPIFDEQGNLLHFFSISTDITERKKLELELKEQQKIITSVAIKAQERERAAVGLELHDNVNQVLTTVKLYTELCLANIANSKELMERSIKLLQESINEIRSLSKRLSAPTLGSIKFKESVEELICTVSATNKLTLLLDAQALQDVDVNEEIHLALYRILQEHLTNILKHADATEATVSFDTSAGITMKVTDNGRGFNTAQRTTGIGITNMITRAESLQGTLILNSKSGAGCTLRVSIPLV